MRDSQKIFVLKDAKSGSYGAPILSVSRGTIIRDLQDELKRGQAVFARHPQDFTLFEVGEYDVENGIITQYDAKECVGLMSDFVINN